MKKKLVWTLILLLIVGGLIFFITRKPDEQVEEEQEIVKEEEKEEEEVEEELETGDFSGFSTERQVLGEESEAVFTLEKVLDESKNGFHEFVFTLSSEDEDEPYVTASFMSSSGAIRVDFQGIGKDSSGIGYQQERSINKNGVLRIYHNVSGQSDQELYDIGVTKETPFKLFSEELETGKWNVVLQVKYPGESDVEVDLGSEEFSKGEQSIDGVGSEKNAAITSYTYGRPSGLMKLVWNVSADGDNPIPNVTASYNEKKELVVVFGSLVLDRVASFTKSMALPSSITGTVERSGEKSTYIFSGMGEREYKISASLSPNQVILEIR
jgi:hypothetical protein